MKKMYFVLLFLFSSIGVSYAQSVSVKGIVKDENGEPVIGASVVIQGTTMGVQTDTKGQFSLNVPNPQSVIEVMFIGYVSQKLAPKANMEIILEPDVYTIQEVVVTGMTQTDRRLFTGATDRLDSEDVKLDGVPDISRALEGRSAGVSVQNVSATFGAAPKIKVRGSTSILGSSNPLWVVDGVIQENISEISSDDLSSGDATTLISSAIAGLNADDIESFQILKDGSATSIYGARAMAGVIVITTKKGKAGKAQINYTGEFTTRLKPSYREFDIMNSQEQMGVYQELEAKGWLNFAETYRARNSGIYGTMYKMINDYDPKTGTFALENTPQAKNNFLRQAEYRNTDWFDLLFLSSIMQTHSISVSSGTEKATNYFSMSIMDDPGWYKKNDVRRYTLNANTSYKLYDNLQLTLRGNASYRKQKAPGSFSQDVNTVYGEIKRDFDINPFSYAMNESRTIDPNSYYTRNYADFNIFEELNNNYLQLDNITAKFQGEISWKPITGLEVAAIAAVGYQSASTEYNIRDYSNISRAYRAMGDATIRDRNPYLYKDPDIINALPISILEDGGIYDKSERKMNDYTIRAHIRYNKVFNDTHIMNLYGATEISDISRTRDWFQGWGMLYEYGELAYTNYLAFKKMAEDNNRYFQLNHTTKRHAAFVANGTYSYKGKYVFNGTYRYEGTNRLGKNRSARWLPTWNISGAWNAHEEDFFKSLAPVLTHLTFRASYSLTADTPDSDIATNSTDLIYSYTPWRPFASVKESGLRVSTPGNSDLTYEKKHELNLGLDLGFLDGRINTTVEVYRRKNFDLIGYSYTQGITGVIRQYANVADMKSRGVEVSVGSRNIVTPKFSWNTDLTFSYTKNEIKKLLSTANVTNLMRATRYSLEGYPVGALFSIPFLGLDEDGLPMFEIEGKKITQKNYSDISFQKTNELEKWMKYEGPTEAPYTGGFSNVFRYRNLRFNVFMTYAFGNKIRMNPIFSNWYSDTDAFSKTYKNRWMVPGDEAHTNIPVISSYRQNEDINALRQAYSAYNYSTARVAKGSFIRMKEISLMYDFPKSMVKSWGMSNLSLKVSGTNLFLLYADKKLNGQDPEYYNVGGVSSPLAKQFTFTLRIGF